MFRLIPTEVYNHGWERDTISSEYKPSRKIMYKTFNINLYKRMLIRSRNGVKPPFMLLRDFPETF